MSTGLTKFGNVGRVSPDIQAYVNSQIATAVQPLVAGVGPSITNGNTIYADTTGKKVKCAPYTMPTTVGTAGQVLEVDAGGNIVYGTGGPPPINPTYLPTLTVTTLSQGPSNLVQNYTLPNYAPPVNSVLASATTYIMNFAVNASISFRVDTINNGTIQFTVPIPIGTYLVSDVLLDLEQTVRRAFNNNNVIADIIFGYDNLANRFSMTLLATTTPSNFINFWWEAYQVSPIPNNNNLFGIGVVIEPRLQLPPISVATCQNAPIGVSLGTDCVWRDLASVQIPAIQSDSGASSIQCEDVGIGQNGIVSYGNYNLNNGSLNNIGNINALDVCNITTNTTQIVNGLGEIKLNADSIDRLIVDDSKSALYSKNALIGPTGSSLTLNNDSTFTLGTYFGGNGSVECSSNSLALVGPQAKSSVVLTDTTITSALFNGSYRADREIMTQTGQLFKDGSGSSRLQIENGIGVIINNVYALPTTIGTAGDVLTRTGATSTTWAAPVALNPFNQSLNTSNNVIFNSIQCNSIDASTPLPMVVAGTIASQIIIGNAATPTTLNGPTIVGQLLTANSGVKTNNIDSITGGSMTISGTTSSAVNIGRTGITTTLKGTTSIDSLFTMPTTAGNSGDVITKNGVGGTIWSAPQINSLYSQTAVKTVANTNVETTLIGAGVGSLSIPANYFTTGMAFRYSTGGVFRDAANNTTFRFRLRNSGVLFDSGILTLPNITVSTAWNIDATFSYVGGTNLITNFNFQYNNGSDARGFTSQNSNNTFNTTIPNTLNFTVQWTVANANNTITTNYGVLEKIY